jgi:hypothetical protein
VVLLQKGKFLSTLCDRMQGALNSVESWCREIGLSVNTDKTTIVLFTNNRKIGSFYNPRLFGTELKMTDQVNYLGMIAWIRSLIGRCILKIGCAKLALHCILSVSSSCGKELGIITKGGGLAIYFRGGTHSFVSYLHRLWN